VSPAKKTPSITFDEAASQEEKVSTPKIGSKEVDNQANSNYFPSHLQGIVHSKLVKVTNA
jgi:hypothetical protein